MATNGSFLLNTIISTTSTSKRMDNIRSFTFGSMDYIVFVLLLCVSSAIGVYFGFFSKSKNTTDEYLMGGKKMKSFPIAISLVARLVKKLRIILKELKNIFLRESYFKECTIMPVRT